MENKTQNAIKQLKDLILDRRSFVKGEPDFDEVFLADIAALEIAVAALVCQIALLSE